MSSDNKKIFTTQATSKGAGATVTSDVLAMPDNTHGHVLNVKADASCSGVVDVELEMSPDGTNWCPAVTRTVAATTTAVEPQIGNEEYVKLTPDAGEFKNKHARGGLNFDVNGAVVTPDGSGARDLMHQHISVDKSFNYSQWFKTSEAPTTTYKPVLFRHGGYDDFENLKVIQTDSNTTTQNLAFKNVVNQKFMEVVSGVSCLSASTSTVKSPWYDSSNQTDSIDVFDTNNGGGVTVGFWCKFNYAGSASGTRYRSFFNIQLSNGDDLDFSIRANSTSRRLGFLAKTGNTTNLYAQHEVQSILFDGNWHYVAMRISSAASPSFMMQLSFDGAAFISAGISSGSISELLSSNLSGVTVSDIVFGGKSYTTVSDIGDDMFIDSLTFIRGELSDTEVASLYANANSPSSANIGSNTVSSFFRFGDGPNDTATSITGTNNLLLTQTSNPPTFSTYTSGDAPEEIFMEQFTSVFDTTANSSISGWFKTTNTGVLFSNTVGAVIDGLKMEVNASNMVLTLIDSSQTITASTDVDDGEWHHLVITKPSGTTPTIKIYIDGPDRDWEPY